MGCCQSTAAIGGPDPDDIAGPSVVERNSLIGGVSRQSARPSAPSTTTVSRIAAQRSAFLGTEAPRTPSSSVALGSCPSFSHFMLQYRDLKPEDFDLLCKLDEGLPGRGTLPQHLVDSLPRRRASECTVSDACGVCLVKFETCTCVVQLPCQHAFHPDCISRWLTQCKSKCPLCSSPISCETGKETDEYSLGKEGVQQQRLMNAAWRKTASSNNEGGVASATSSSLFENERNELLVS